MTEPLVSIIVPVLSDAGELERLLASFPASPDAELIVVNGDPGDAAVEALRARFTAARWHRSLPGRWRQMNHGATLAGGRWLLFLHADGRLSPDWLQVVAEADRDPRIVGGSYRLELDSPARAARLLEWGVARRVRWAGYPYGDQALFVRREVFAGLGGYRPMDLMEDVDFVRRLKRAGGMLHSDVPVRVSARRWEHDGWIRRSGENIALVLLFFAGVSPARLARRYYRNGAARPLRGARS